MGTYERVRRLAAAEDRSMVAVIGRALDVYEVKALAEAERLPDVPVVGRETPTPTAAAVNEVAERRRAKTTEDVQAELAAKLEEEKAATKPTKAHRHQDGGKGGTFPLCPCGARKVQGEWVGP